MTSKNFFKSKGFTAILMLLVAIVYLFQINDVIDRKIDLNGDNIYYFTLAQSLASGQGYSSIIGLDEPVPHMHFPPGYSAFLSVFMRLGIDSTMQVKIINCILLLAGILLLFLIMRRAGCGPVFCAAVCILTSFHAEVLRWASMMMSEQLFLVVNLLIIYLLCTVDFEDIFSKASWRNWVKIVLAGLLAGYSYLIRTMGTSMTVAVILWSIVLSIRFLVNKTDLGTGRLKKAAGYGLAALVVLVSMLGTKGAWDARNERISPGFHSDYLGDFNKKEGGKTMDSLTDWVDRAERNFKSYITCYIPDALFEKQENTPEKEAGAADWIGGALVFLLIVLGLGSAYEPGLLMLLYCGVTFGVLLVWPEQYSGLRYFVTLIPLLIFGFCRGLFVAAELVVKKVTGKSDAEGIALVPVLIFMLVAVPRYNDAQGYYHEVAKVKNWKNAGNPAIRQYALASEWIGRNLPEDARLICRKPELLYMMSGYRHSNNFPQYATPEEIMELIDGSNIEYILLDVMYIHAYRTIYPAIAKYPERFRAVMSWTDKGNDLPTLLVQVVR